MEISLTRAQSLNPLHVTCLSSAVVQLFVLGIQIVVTTNSAKGQGMRSTPEAYKLALKIEPEDIAGFGAKVPTAHDMLQYAPPAYNQDGGTCVGWAAGHCAMSILANKSFGIVHPIHKDLGSFDPLFTYTIANSGTVDPCDEGMFIGQHFEIQESIGIVRELFPPTLFCYSQWQLDEDGIPLSNQYQLAAAPYKMTHWGWLNTDTTGWLRDMKTYLANDIPLVFGAIVNDNLDFSWYGGQIGPDAVWKYENTENGEAGLHAMCIIGYDDSVAGGAFLVRNSWGDNFGVEGNFWLRYSDFQEVEDETWVLEPDEWWENLDEPDTYEVTIKETGSVIQYQRVEMNQSIFEGFYFPGERMLAYHFFKDGTVYFGECKDYLLDGKGYYWDEAGDRYSVKSRQGRLIKSKLGFVQNEGQEETTNELYLESLFESETPEFTGELPNPE